MEGRSDRRQERDRGYMQWKLAPVYVIKVEGLIKQSD
jgi:hypothetical protein